MTAALPRATRDALPHQSTRAQRKFGAALELGTLVMAGTALSWLCTGHVFGHSNNVFHLPIVAGLAARPGFENDAFVQSLAGFASGLWMLFEGADAFWPAPALFAFGLAVSKALTLLGLVAVARTVGTVGTNGTAGCRSSGPGTPKGPTPERSRRTRCRSRRRA